jgi:predicted SAM-dependent methyltransferase
MNVITYQGDLYPAFQTVGNAAQFAIPFAKHLCKGKGYDIGCMKEEWSFPGSIPIDIRFDDPYDANNLPDEQVDYIFSSHCLEHIDDWVSTMDYWYSKLKIGGTLFLYLPDYSQKYWRPWNNRKHKHYFGPAIIGDYMDHRGYKNVFVSGIDLNSSFMVVGEK